MGFYKTNNCFFTGKEVISNNEPDGRFLDGYYYRIEYFEKVREFILSGNDRWDNDLWLMENGGKFIDLIEKHNKWDFFKTGKKLDDVKNYYNVLINL